MSHTLLRGCALLMLLGIGVLGGGSAHAAKITCTGQTMSDLIFGDVSRLSSETNVTATFSATCTNDATINPRAATICLSIGSQRQMTGGSDTLDFQLYQDPSYSIVWGSQSLFGGAGDPLKMQIVLPANGTMQINATLYGRVLAGQEAVAPGIYMKQFLAGNDARMTVEAPITGSTPPAACQNNPTAFRYFPFAVSANVVNKCTVTAASLNFGTNLGLLNTDVNASATLGVQCSNTTPYNVGLSAGQNAGGNINARKMVLDGNSIAYQLYRDSARTLVWGNTVNSDTVAGTGTGNTQNLTVYGKVPAQTTPPAGTYNDTIVVTVTY